MNIFLREIINRFINYLVNNSSGGSYEEKIESLLRKTLLFCFMALVLAGTMTSKFLVGHWYLEDLEKSLVKIDQFMVTQQSNINQMFRINGDQYKTIVKLNKENRDLRDNIRMLVVSQISLEKENKALRDEKLKMEQQKIKNDKKRH